MKTLFFDFIFLVMCITNVLASNNVDTTYTFYDAARNKFVLNGNSLEYVPTTAIESSSGIYNGGMYKTRVLTEKEYKELAKIFNAALADKKAQTIKNIKPNAAVEISIGGKKTNFLLKSTTAKNIALHNYLKQLFKI